ncbi:MAG: extracellular solute-binding protein [Caldilineales bacterium]
MSSKTIKILLALAVVTAMLLSACGPAETPAPAQEAPPAAATEAPTVAPTEPPAAEPTAAEEPTEAPMEEPTAAPAEEAAMPAVDPTGQNIVFWHVWGTGGPSEALQAIVDEFNASNEYGITVESLEQGQYNNLEDAFNAAVQSGDLPDMVTGYTNAMANWYAVDSIVDLTPTSTMPTSACLPTSRLPSSRDRWMAVRLPAARSSPSPSASPRTSCSTTPAGPRNWASRTLPPTTRSSRRRPAPLLKPTTATTIPTTTARAAWCSTPAPPTWPPSHSPTAATC